MVFIKVDREFVIEEDPQVLLDELLWDTLPREFWTRKEWMEFAISKMKLQNLVGRRRRDERFRED